MPGQDSHRRMIHLLLSLLQTIFLIRSSPSPLHRLATQDFDEHCKCKQTESFLSQTEHTIWVSTHRTLRTQYLHLDVFLKPEYNSCTLQWLLKVAKFLIMYSFTHTNITIFINVCYQMKCFSGDSFSFLGSRFS